jgi:hypothetical protein
METFHEWLQRRDPELAENVLKKIFALGLPMASAMAGGATGLAAGGPLAAVPGWMAGKAIGTKASEKLFPRDTAELMRKMKK